jgi:hypothetical protein
MPIDLTTRIAIALLLAFIEEEERSKILSFSDCHDVMDGNQIIYGTFCAAYFREPNFDHPADVDILNEISAKLDDAIKGGALSLTLKG